jgi:hypothetical protein
VLNKVDLFQECIKTRSLRATFSEYTGGSDFDIAVDFIRRKFEDKNHREERPVYTVLTDSSSTNAVQETFNNVSGILLRNPNHKFKFLSWLVAAKVLPNLYKKTKYADITFMFGGSVIEERIYPDVSSPSRIISKKPLVARSSTPPLQKRFSQKIKSKVESFRIVKKTLKRWDSLGDVVAPRRVNSCVIERVEPRSPVSHLRLDSLSKFRPGGEFSPECGRDDTDSSDDELSEHCVDLIHEAISNGDSTESESEETPRLSEGSSSQEEGLLSVTTEEEHVRQLILSMVNNPEDDESSSKRRRSNTRERSPLGKVRAMTPPPSAETQVETVTRERVLPEPIEKAVVQDPSQYKFCEKLAMFKELERARSVALKERDGC